MTLSTASRFLKNSVAAAIVAAMSLALAACDSLIYDGEGDCTVHYRLSFRYTKNILNADAFASQVTDINVAVYDKQGNMVAYKTDTRALSEENDYFMEIDILPGTYDIIAWCEGQSNIENAVSFNLLGQEPGDMMTRSGAELTLGGTSGQPTFSSDINRLYYGSLTDVEFPDSYGIVNIQPIPLTKDTNHITLQLQNMNGQPIDSDLFTFELQGANSCLDWQNNLVGTMQFNYTPWSVEQTYTPAISALPASRADSGVPSGIQAEFTTGRIMADVAQQMTVRKAGSGETILTFPLVKYLLLVRGKYEEATSSQDYLDRYDDFTLVFFIDESFTWIKSRVYINGWRVVPPQDENI